MNRAFDLILFDLDGTLIETAPEIADAVNDTLRRFDLPAVSQQQVNDWIGHGTRELLIQALAWAGQTSADTVRFSDSFKLIEQAFGGYYEAPLRHPQPPPPPGARGADRAARPGRAPGGGDQQGRSLHPDCAGRPPDGAAVSTA
jgi:phosphoglycolate phosphatase-like HAD superfamily hydrolase